VIGGFALFERALVEMPEVQDLTSAALTPEARNALYQWTREVSRRPVDPEFVTMTARNSTTLFAGAVM
jgi:hypothetical protein